MTRHIAPWLALWLALFWLWLLLAGEWNRYEWIAAACAASVAATVGEIARSRAEISVRVPLDWIARSWSALPMVVVDFGILMWALVRSAARREVVRGTFRVHDFPAGGGDRRSTGIRAWASYAANFSPNAYVIDVDRDRQVVLLHDLVPHTPSEKPAAQ